MHAATEDNGELWAATRGAPARIRRGIQNLPFIFVVALRNEGAAYYTASLPGATGAAPYPSLRPVGIDTWAADGPLVAAVQQRILGEVGYRVDTRVYGIDVAVVDSWASQFGTAHAADGFEGTGALDGRTPAVGERWRADAGLVLGDAGLRPAAGDGVATATIGVVAASGLLHAVLDAGRAPGQLGLRWRLAGAGAHLAVQLDETGCSLLVRSADGDERVLLADPARRMQAGRRHILQVLDDGATVAVHLDGELVGGQWTAVDDLADGGGLEVALRGDIALRSVEAHPRHVPIPEELDCGAPWAPPPSAPVFEERFDLVGVELAGATTPSGGRPWQRVEGEGAIELLGGHARVRADRERPNPGRTIFTVPWDDPGFADLELEMTIPGTGGAKVTTVAVGWCSGRTPTTTSW